MKATVRYRVTLVFALVAVGLAVSSMAVPTPAAGGADTALTELAGPHCCGSGASAACRDLCKQQGPGCKGSIGCRAGECVCTCSCP